MVPLWPDGNTILLGNEKRFWVRHYAADKRFRFRNERDTPIEKPKISLCVTNSDPPLCHHYAHKRALTLVNMLSNVPPLLLTNEVLLQCDVVREPHQPQLHASRVFWGAHSLLLSRHLLKCNIYINYFQELASLVLYKKNLCVQFYDTNTRYKWATTGPLPWQPA